MRRVVEKRKGRSRKELQEERRQFVKKISMGEVEKRLISGFEKILATARIHCEVEKPPGTEGTFIVRIRQDNKKIFYALLRIHKKNNRLSLRIDEIQGQPHRKAEAHNFEREHGEEVSKVMVKLVTDAAYEAEFDSVLLYNITRSKDYAYPHIENEKLADADKNEEILRIRSRMKKLYTEAKKIGRFNKAGKITNTGEVIAEKNLSEENADYWIWEFP